MEALAVEPQPEGDGIAWHSEHPYFWRVFGWVWLRVRWKIWEHGGQELFWRIGKRAPVHKWWIRWADPGFMPCQTCGYVWEWGAHDGWFKCENAGTSYCPGYTDTHWFEGTQTCPRCRSQWYYSDSD